MVVIRLPHFERVSLRVFVRTGSRYETARMNGIGQVVERMLASHRSVTVSGLVTKALSRGLHICP